MTHYKISYILTPTSKGHKYAVYGDNKAGLKMLKAKFGEPMPSGHFILGATAFFGLVAEVINANARADCA